MLYGTRFVAVPVKIPHLSINILKAGDIKDVQGFPCWDLCVERINEKIGVTFNIFCNFKYNILYYINRKHLLYFFKIMALHSFLSYLSNLILLVLSNHSQVHVKSVTRCLSLILLPFILTKRCSFLIQVFWKSSFIIESISFPLLSTRSWIQCGRSPKPAAIQIEKS